MAELNVHKLSDLDLADQRVLIRADLNVPIKSGEVTSDVRIRASLPSIQHALAAGARRPARNESRGRAL